MDEYCRIELLGGLCVRKGNREIKRFRTKKAELLLAYLACFSQRSQSRDALIGLLWPESDLQAGRSNLRAELSGLRVQFKSLGIPPKEALIADRSTVRLNPSLFVIDVGEFEAALRAAAQSNDVSQRIEKLMRAVDLYHDKLLPGHYDDWIIREQERLAEVYRGALRQVAQCFQEAHDHDRALHYAQRAIQEDPLCEESHRLLMRLHSAAGQPEIALRHYEEMKLTLQEKLEASPDDETVNLAAEIRQQLDAKTARQQVRRPRLPYKRTRFFGREEEIEALIALLKPAPQPIPSDTPKPDTGNPPRDIDRSWRFRENSACR